MTASWWNPQRIAGRIPLPEQHVLGIGLGLALQRLVPVRSPKRLEPLGWVLLAAGAAVNGWAVSERGDLDIDRPRSLTTTGLHARTRNPMYLGWSAIHLGAGLVLGSPWVVGTWPATAVFVHRQILDEEDELIDLFGDDYAEYRRRAPRYLGPFPRAAVEDRS